MTKQEKNYLLKLLLKIITCISIASVFLITVLHDVMVNKNIVEGGLTEKIQLILIAGAGSLYAFRGIRQNEFKLCNILVSILFLLFFVRELDAYFDNLFFHGAWFYIVLEILLLSFLYFRDLWRDVLAEIVGYSKTQNFLLFVFGIIVLIFLARIFGHKVIWKTLFFNIPAENITDLEQYYRPFKNVAEEVTEVIAYLALFISALNPFSSKKSK